MKPISIHLFAFLIAGGFFSADLPARAQNVAKPPFRINSDGSVDHKELLKLTRQPTASDRITDEALEAIKSQHKIDYGPGFRPTAEPEMPPRADLYASSVLLSDGINHTLIPEKALVWVPDHLKDRVVEAPVGRLILFPQFLQENRRWLRAEEIDLSTATGETPMDEAVWERLKSANTIVVSVHQSNPISLLPPAQPKEANLAGEPGASPASTGSGAAGQPAGSTSLAAVPEKAGEPEAEPESKASPTGGLRPGRFDVSDRFRGRFSK